MQAAQDPTGAAIPMRSARDRAVLGFFVSQLVALIYLQKFAVPAGAFQIAVLIPIIFLGIALMALSMRLQISAVRLVIYAAFFASIVFSQSQVKIPYSAPSMLITMLMPLPFVFVWKVDSEMHLTIMKTFQKLMLIPIAFVLIQLLWQVAFGMGNMPTLTKLFPAQFLRQGFNYEGFIKFGDPFRRPNGMFLLEPSFISCFIGTALLIELTFFRRIFWMGFFAAALIATFAATGQLLTLIAAPLLLHKQSPRVLAAGALAAALGAVAMVAMGKGVSFDRIYELGSANTSGYLRMVAPLIQLGDALQRHDVLFTGAGAGNVDHTRSSVWPITKLMYEYGFMTTFTFVGLLIVSMWKSPALALAIGLFMVINFVGGYLQEPAVMWLIALLCCMMKVSDEPPRETRLSRRTGLVPGMERGAPAFAPGVGQPAATAARDVAA